MTNPKLATTTVGRLIELLSEEVTKKPANELLAEAREQMTDVDAHVREIRRYLENCVAELRKAKTSSEEVPAASKADPQVRQFSGTAERVGTLTTIGEASYINWTNRSVLTFAQGLDPLRRMTERVEQVVNKALELGWEGPPYDPFRLAELLRISVVPRSDISEARTIAGPQGRFLIEFNPHLPVSRIRFSLAHEIAHTFFSDCLERARYRARRAVYSEDDWQLEVLCNVGAAELLMPTGSFSSLRQEGFDIIRLMELRKTLGVSTEAILLRAVKLATTPIACFVATRRGDRLRTEYTVFSRVWASRPITIPHDTLVQDCSAMGAIAKGNEAWNVGGEKLRVDIQAVGLPPYQGQEQPRVAGLFRPKTPKFVAVPSVEYLVGNALKPLGTGKKVVAHIVNDTTPRWGGSGFAAAVKKEWPEVQDDFKQWVHTRRHEFRLGAIRVVTRFDDLSVVSMVAQHGYGPSDRPRIRYGPLELCLVALADFAAEQGRTVHIPKIGTGYAKGNWSVIEELIERLVCARGLRVFVYQLQK